MYTLSMNNKARLMIVSICRDHATKEMIQALQDRYFIEKPESLEYIKVFQMPMNSKTKRII